MKPLKRYHDKKKIVEMRMNGRSRWLMTGLVLLLMLLIVGVGLVVGEVCL